MRAVVQRVNHASVTVLGVVVGRIERGVCVLVGVGRGDEASDATALAEKVVNLRIFEDDAQKMNLSLLEIGGALLAVSQFTLFGDVRRGKRPSFSEALEPVRAQACSSTFAVSVARAAQKWRRAISHTHASGARKRRSGHDLDRQQTSLLSVRAAAFDAKIALISAAAAILSLCSAAPSLAEPEAEIVVAGHKSTRPAREPTLAAHTRRSQRAFAARRQRGRDLEPRTGRTSFGVGQRLGLGDRLGARRD